MAFAGEPQPDLVYDISEKKLIVLYSHGNCYIEGTVCCDDTSVQCSIGKLCNACPSGQTCNGSGCSGGPTVYLSLFHTEFPEPARNRDYFSVVALLQLLLLYALFKSILFFLPY